MKTKAKQEANRLFLKANAAWDAGDVKTAFDLFQRAAELGDPSSQLDLGYFFDCGLHVPKDKSRALYWYLRAYRQGKASAASNIATIHRDCKNPTKMVWWFRRAIAMGDNDALLELGKSYQTGIGVRKDPNRAERCYQRLVASQAVTEHGREQAMKLLAKVRMHRTTKSACSPSTKRKNAERQRS